MTDTSAQPLNDDDNIQEIGVFYEAKKRKKYIIGGVAILLTIILIIIIAVAATGSDSSSSSSRTWPVMMDIWVHRSSVDAGYEAMVNSGTSFKSLDGVVAGVQYCQTNCNGGITRSNIDSDGRVTQSAMVMWGPKMESGSVANLYNIADAVSVARDVLAYTDHSIIVGEAATRFAIQQGYNLTNLTQEQTIGDYQEWVDGGCEKNFWRNVRNGNSCLNYPNKYDNDRESDWHDITGCDANETGSIEANNKLTDGGTVTGATGMIAIDENGEMAIATSSNGLKYKIAGRVSDAAIPGAGGYIDPFVGGCLASGHGDIIIRFAAAKTAVTFMKTGSTPTQAAQAAVDEIEAWCGNKQAIVLCLSKDGEPGIASVGSGNPSFGYRSSKCSEAVQASANDLRGGCV